MQNVEVVVVNFGPGKPIYTESVYPDPEVRSLAAQREEQARLQRREARRQNRHAHRHQTASRAQGQQNNRQQREEQSDLQSNSSRNSAPQIGNRNAQVRSPTLLRIPRGDSQNNNEGSNSYNSNSDAEITTPSLLRVPLARISSIDEALSRCPSQPEPPDSRYHPELATNRQLCRITSSNQQQPSLPLANQHRHHPDEGIEEWWLSPEPSPINSPSPSPINSPVVKQIGKKWRRKTRAQHSGCDTCRGDLAIISHQRPRLRDATFSSPLTQVAINLVLSMPWFV